MLHIIGLVVNLSATLSAKLSFLSRILKKDSSELKHFCLELGLRLEPCKTKDRETEQEIDDFIARLKNAKSTPQKADK